MSFLPRLSAKLQTNKNCLLRSYRVEPAGVVCVSPSFSLDFWAVYAASRTGSWVVGTKLVV